MYRIRFLFSSQANFITLMQHDGYWLDKTSALNLENLQENSKLKFNVLVEVSIQMQTDTLHFNFVIRIVFHSIPPHHPSIVA